jgi:nicotinamidase-related amidase
LSRSARGKNGEKLHQLKLWEERMKMRFVFIGVLGLAAVASAPSAGAATIIDEWASAKAEAAPELKPATIDPKTTALLVMDLVKGSCNAERRPRCVASIPTIEKFLTEARAKGVTIIHTVAGSGGVADILPPVVPKEGETVLTGTVANKFIRTDLQKILKDKGITTVIPVGTAAQGAVLFTGSEAAFLQFKVVVPVDGASAENLVVCTRARHLGTNHADALRHDEVPIKIVARETSHGTTYHRSVRQLHARLHEPA